MFNRKLRKKLERFGKVEMIDVIGEIHFYTKHGQHLNSAGKESMSQKIATTIDCLLNRKVELISGKWYNDEETDSQEHQVLQGKIGNIQEDEKVSAVVHQVY